MVSVLRSNWLVLFSESVMNAEKILELDQAIGEPFSDRSVPNGCRCVDRAVLPSSLVTTTFMTGRPWCSCTQLAADVVLALVDLDLGAGAGRDHRRPQPRQAGQWWNSVCTSVRRVTCCRSQAGHSQRFRAARGWGPSVSSAGVEPDPAGGDSMARPPPGGAGDDQPGGVGRPRPGAGLRGGGRDPDRCRTRSRGRSRAAPCPSGVAFAASRPARQRSCRARRR
jgi:hypothetical protein